MRPLSECCWCAGTPFFGEWGGVSLDAAQEPLVDNHDGYVYDEYSDAIQVQQPEPQPEPEPEPEGYCSDGDDDTALERLAADDTGYDYGDYGGVSLEDAAAFTSSDEDEEQHPAALSAMDREAAAMCALARHICRAELTLLVDGSQDGAAGGDGCGGQ